jgi:hypothetical protein
MVRGWRKTVDDEFICTGGGIDYYITFFRNIKNPRRQIEVFQDIFNGKRKQDYAVNIGTLFEKTDDVYEFIQGDYIETKGFRSKSEAMKFAMKYMRGHPNG